MRTDEATMSPEEAGRVFVMPEAFADMDHFHRAASVLRRLDPIHRVDHPGYDPFYVLTKHADVWDVEHHHEVFHNAPRPILVDRSMSGLQTQQGEMLRPLIGIDGPIHTKYRALTMDWFKPRSLARLDDQIATLARRAVNKMVDLGDECDFARDIAMEFPLQVILSIVGLPESDYPLMLKLTQEIFGSQDPELSRGTKPEEVYAVVLDFFTYFNALIEERRARPTDDLASLIANATFDGEPMPTMDQMSYYVILATTGHDTTSSAMAGGVQALIENPDQLDRLRRDPSLIATAADEIIRWVTPVRHFMRTATEPYEVRGHRFAPGDWVLLSYPSANRDDEEFDDPFSFEVRRSPNRHLAFGFGVHYCLGAMLAKKEIKALLNELVPRLRSIEFAGKPELSSSFFVGGHKRLPIRYEVTGATG